jgi:hypothetical protein
MFVQTRIAYLTVIVASPAENDSVATLMEVDSFTSSEMFTASDSINVSSSAVTPSSSVTPSNLQLKMNGLVKIQWPLATTFSGIEGCIENLLFDFCMPSLLSRIQLIRLRSDQCLRWSNGPQKQLIPQ